VDETLATLCCAVFDMAPQAPTDVAFHEGDFIFVAERPGNWWMGEVAGTGVFGSIPSNYVSVCLRVMGL